jgi:polysaccharide export outer membrane protein
MARTADTRRRMHGDWRKRLAGAAALAAALAGAWLALRPAAEPTPAARAQPPTSETGLSATVPPSASRVLLAAPTAAAAPQEAAATMCEVRLCQCRVPADCGTLKAVDGSLGLCRPGEARWTDSRPMPWQMYGPGDYVGPFRPEHLPEYRLRVDDVLEFVYRLTRDELARPYELNVGDVIRVESLVDNPADREAPTQRLDRELVVQPDGTITLPLLGQVRAARRTVQELRDDLEGRYKKYIRVPAITVTPIRVETKLEDLRATVDSRAGAGGQSRQARVTPEGTLALPAIGSVPAQGLTLDELKREIDERYAAIVGGIEVTPILVTRAPRFVYVLGEVRAPGRYELTAPTTVMQGIALAGGWTNGGNLREIVVFRRGEDWRLVATRLDLRGALLGKRPCPADEIWLRDSDLVVIPKSPIMLFDDFVELVFTRGAYGVVPFSGVSISYSRGSSL